MELMDAGDKQLQSEDPHFKIGGCWFLRATERDFSASPREENKNLRGPTDEGRRQNQYVAHFFSLSSSLLLSLSFYPCFSTQRRNLCYLLVTFIWSPRVLDLSLSLLSHSPSTLFSPLFSSHLLRLLSRYRLPTARSLEQSGTSYSGFQTRRQGSCSLSSSSSSYFSFFGRRQSFWSHHLVPLIRGSLISRTTSVKIDNRASTRAATLCTATKTRTTFFFV